MNRIARALLVSFVLILPGAVRAGDRDRLEAIAGVMEQGGHARAAGLLEAYLEEESKDEDLALTMLGNVYEELDRDAEADRAYVSAIRSNPKRVEAITGRGILARKRGDLDAAVGFYEQALAIDPRYGQAISSLVAIFVLREDYPKAVAYGERAYRLDPRDPVVAGNLAWAYQYAGDAAKRDEMTEVAKRLGYAHADALEELAAE